MKPAPGGNGRAPPLVEYDLGPWHQQQFGL
jgi:hypothetical protein